MVKYEMKQHHKYLRKSMSDEANRAFGTCIVGKLA